MNLRLSRRVDVSEQIIRQRIRSGAGRLPQVRRIIDGRFAVHEARLNDGVIGAVLIQTGGDNGNANLVAHAVVINRTEDDKGIAVCVVLDGFHSGTNFGHADAFLSRNVNQQTLSAAKFNTFKQRAGNGHGGSRNGTIGTFGFAGTHHGGTAGTHNRSDVFEVQVDLTNLLNQFGDACAGVEEHFVGLLKAFAHRGVFSELFFELIVKNDNQRVDAVFELI